MRALTLVADRQLVIAQMPAPPPPRAEEVQIAVKAVALNHIDVWGYRGMAFAKRKLPLVVGAEASGEIAAVGEGVTRFKPGQSGNPSGRVKGPKLQDAVPEDPEGRGVASRRRAVTQDLKGGSNHAPPHRWRPKG